MEWAEQRRLFSAQEGRDGRYWGWTLNNALAVETLTCVAAPDPGLLAHPMLEEQIRSKLCPFGQMRRMTFADMNAMALKRS